MKTVLIVDDDEQLRKILAKMLKQAGLKAIEARNGTECISLYKTKSPDLVVMDIIMPEKDGLSTIKAIKEIDNQAKVLAMSGGLVMTPEVYLDEAKNIGADSLISKPIDRRFLMETIENLLG
ncbi:Response regulator receiver protein [Desulfosarcina cetonica]|uniref:response regulator n=1 Tax=Desulfosarcina cetonica TaxID=90730 RepID=UPI0006CFAEC4|nr:response regulator [Desulfosarcina cetonica]VTR71108.1 Response regulator receiver protein [Desulfosarcina cetonica]